MRDKRYLAAFGWCSTWPLLIDEAHGDPTARQCRKAWVILLATLGHLRPALVSTALSKKLVGAKIGDARLVREGEDDQEAFTLIDSFDNQIGAADMALIATQDDLVLIAPDTAVTRQDFAAPDFVDHMPEGPLTAKLGKIVDPLRRLLVRAEGTVSCQMLKIATNC